MDMFSPSRNWVVEAQTRNGGAGSENVKSKLGRWRLANDWSSRPSQNRVPDIIFGYSDLDA
jgi:hypothetical protein